jgi:hypothetical protein
MYGIVHEKTDVFAYGVLLLELISGRRPIDHAQQSLVIWVRIALSASVCQVRLYLRHGETYANIMQLFNQ